MGIGEIFYNLIRGLMPQLHLPPWSSIPTTAHPFWNQQAVTYADWSLQFAFAQGETQTKIATRRAGINVKFGKCACCSVSPNDSLFPTCAGGGTLP